MSVCGDARPLASAPGVDRVAQRLNEIAPAE